MFISHVLIISMIHPCLILTRGSKLLRWYKLLFLIVICINLLFIAIFFNITIILSIYQIIVHLLFVDEWKSAWFVFCYWRITSGNDCFLYLYSPRYYPCRFGAKSSNSICFRYIFSLTTNIYKTLCSVWLLNIKLSQLRWTCVIAISQCNATKWRYSMPVDYLYCSTNLFPAIIWLLLVYCCVLDLVIMS